MADLDLTEAVEVAAVTMPLAVILGPSKRGKR